MSGPSIRCAPATRSRYSRRSLEASRMIRVQREDFDTGKELERLSAGDHTIGGVASFVGLVRDLGGPRIVTALTIAFYTGMTVIMLAECESVANRRHTVA